MQMTQPRSANNSYSSREYSYKSQITNELPTKESRYHRSDTESFFHKEPAANIFQSPRTTARFQMNSSTKTASSSHNASSPGSYIVVEPELQWTHPEHANSVLSAAMATRIRSNSPGSIADSHNIQSFSLPQPVNNERDQFSIFGSFKKQRSERRTNSNQTEVANVVESSQVNYRNLPVKSRQQQQSPLQQQQPQQQQHHVQQSQLSPNTRLPTNAELHTSGYFTPSLQNMSFDEPDSRRWVEPEEPIVKAKTQRENQANPLPKQYSNEISEKNDSESNPEEIERLNKNLDKVHTKMKALQKNNEELKNHVKNLLIERKQLIKQIENTEFEEIIEEEEIQRAKSNLNPKEDSNQQRSVSIKEEVVSENLIEKSKVKLSDLPPMVLNNYRKEIIDQEREKIEIEKRTLMEALNIQYQQQLQSLKREHELQQAIPVKTIPVQSIKRTKFHEIAMETDIPNSKVPLRSIATNFQPPVATKSSQNEPTELNKKLAKETTSLFQNHMKRSQIKTTKWHDSILQRITQSLESNNPTELASVIGEMMFKPSSRSIEVTAKPLIVSRQSQTDPTDADNGKMAKQTDILLKSFIKKTGTTTTKWQTSIIDRFVDSLQANNSQKLSSLLEEILFKTSRTIGVNSVPLNSTKTTQTDQRNFSNIIYDVNMSNDKPIVEKISKSVSFQPDVLHKSSQQDELYQFETGTMTDHIFYRSQGVNTFGDHPKTATSPYSEMESYTTRTSNLSTAKRQIKSQTTIVQSATNHIASPVKDIQSPIIPVKQANFQSRVPEAFSIDELDAVKETKTKKDFKETRNSNLESRTDSVDNSKSQTTKQIPITISKTISETANKPKHVVEELEQKIEETVQILTAHVDKDHKLKEETQTTVECWETVSKIKDGKLIEKKENYRDKFISSDPVEILKHLESHSHDDHHHTEQDSPNTNAHMFSVISGQESKSRSNNISESSEHSTNIPYESSTNVYQKTHSTASSTIPVFKSTVEKNTSKYENMSSTPLDILTRLESHTHDMTKEMSPSNTGSIFSGNSGREYNAGSAHEYREKYEYKTNLSGELSKGLTEKRVKSEATTSSTIPIRNINTSEYGTSETITEMPPRTTGSSHEYSERYEYKTNVSNEPSKDLTKERVNIPISSGKSENAYNQSFSTNPIWQSLDEKDSCKSENLKHSDSSIQHQHKNANETYSNRGEQHTSGLRNQHTERNEYRTNFFTESSSSSSKGLMKEEVNIPIDSGFTENIYRKTQTNSTSTIPIFSSTMEKNTSEFEGICSSPIGVLKHLESHTHEQIRGISPSTTSHGFSMISGRESSTGSTHEYSERHEYKTNTSTELLRDMSKDRVSIPISTEVTGNVYRKSETTSSSTIPLFINTSNIPVSEYDNICLNPSEVLKQFGSHTHGKTTSEILPSDRLQGFTTISGKESNTGSSHGYTEKYEYKTNISTESSKDFSKEGLSIPIGFELSDNRDSQTISSSTIPIFKSTGERITSRHENISKITTKLPVVSTRHETSRTEHIMSPTNGSVTLSDSTEPSSSSISHDIPSSMSVINSPGSITSFSSKSNSSLPKQTIITKKDKSDFESSGKRKETHVKSNANNSKSTVVRKLIKTQNVEMNSPSQSTDLHDHQLSPKAKNTKIQINRLHGSESSAAIRSGNSAFHSISEQKQFVPLTMNDNAEQLEVLLPENIFQLASQVLVWLNGNNRNLEQMPQEMIRSSMFLIDWWVDMVVKLTANHLATTIQYLISTFSINLVRVLINNRDQQGNTCLHYIIGHQRWESFSVLCATGLVDPNIYNIQGFTVMMLASTLQVSDDILNGQIRKLTVNANINLQSKEQGQTAIYLASLHNNDNTILFLYSLGADINIPDYEGNTPLLVAVSKNNVKAVKAIISCPKALLELQNKEGQNALKIAEINNFSAIISLFQQRKPVTQTQRSSVPTILGVVSVSRPRKLYEEPLK